MEGKRKIAIVGAMCSGKTSLVNYFSKFDSVATLQDEGRLYLTNHPEVPRDTGELQLEILKRTIQAENNARYNSILLCDCSALTPIAHLLAYGLIKDTEDAINNYADHLRSYNHYYLMSIEGIELESDSIRKESESFRQKLQSSYIQLLEELGLPYTLVKGTLDERAKFIIDELEIKASRASLR